MSDRPQFRTRMVFHRFGRAYHLRIAALTDLEHALDLDDAHWVAISAPIETLLCDAVFLSHLDSDGDGRIRPDELREAIRWLRATLDQTRGVDRASDTLELAAVSEDTEDGRRIRKSVAKVAARLGRDGAISLADVRGIMAIEEGRAVSEAGVVLVEATDDPEVAALLEAILSTVGGTPHPCGKVGVSQAHLEAFVNHARAHLAWREAGERDAASISPLGDATAPAFQAFSALRDKLNQYFAQCRAVAVEPALATRLGVSFAGVDLGDPDALAAAQERAPLAAPSRSGTLDVSGAINPVYTSRVQALWTRVVEPLRAARAARLADAASAGDGVSAADDADATGDRAAPAHPARGADGGRTAPGQYSDAGLSQAEWARIQDELAPYEAWLSAKAGANVELLGAEVLRGLLAPRLADAICALIETSRETAIVLDNLRLVEKLILYQANIIRFANNFVSFPDLYARGRRTLFDLGDLVMDGRRFNLAVRVGDRAEHVKMARSGNIYVLYVEVTGRNEDPYQVAVAVTSGGRGNLVVGKRGVFRQRDGSERDARIVEVIESPISLGEAIAAPFRRIAKAITGQIESIAGTAEKQLDKASASAIPAPGEGGDKGASGEDSAGGKDGADAKPASQSASSPPTQGGVTARGALTGGVAIAAMGSALAYVTETLSQLSRWQIASGVGGAIAAVIIPTIVLALLKLRSRDLSAILEGSGWAINARMRLTYRQSYYLTERPPYPTTARGLGRRWIKWALIALVLASLAIAGWRVVRARWGDKPQTQPAAPTAPATPSAPAAPPGP